MASLASFASSTSATCNKPTGTASGDVLVALVSSAGSAAAITGWTSQVSANFSSFYFETLLTKVAGGSEPSSYSVSAGPVVESFIILRVTDADTSAVIDGTPTSASSGVCGSITTTVPDSLLVMGSVATGTISPDASMSEAVETGPGGTYSLYGNAATEARASAGATGSRTQTSGGTVVASVMVAIKGAASGTALVEPPDATATTAGIAPSLSADANIATPDATATSAALAPTISADGVLTSVTATATSDAFAPTLTADALVAVPAATATTAAPAPAVVGEFSVVVLAPTATATTTALTPGMVADALITAIAAEANTAAYTPAVGIFANVLAPVATATTDAGVPDIRLGIRVYATAATSESAAFAPMAGQTYQGVPWDGGSSVAYGQAGANIGAISMRPHATGSMTGAPDTQSTHSGIAHPTGSVTGRIRHTARITSR